MMQQQFKRIGRALGLLLASATVILQAPRLAERGALGDVPAALSELPVLATEAAFDAGLALADRREPTGRHLGFDTYSYPGDRVMRSWRTAAPYEWVGYYLSSPCHKETSWMGKRERLTEMGWGLAVIYVGQQTWDGHRAPPLAPALRARRGGEMVCHKGLVTAYDGRADAVDAVMKTASEGFPRGTAIFLDVERMDLTPPAMRAYYKEWVRGVLTDGRFRPAVYLHKHNAALIERDVRAVYDEMGAAGEPAFWIAGGRGFSAERRPHEVGHDFADIWQGVLDVTQTWGGISLHVDVNVAAVPSPSSHAFATVPRYAARARTGSPAAPRVAEQPRGGRDYTTGVGR